MEHLLARYSETMDTISIFFELDCSQILHNVRRGEIDILPSDCRVDIVELLGLISFHIDDDGDDGDDCTTPPITSRRRGHYAFDPLFFGTGSK